MIAKASAAEEPLRMTKEHRVWLQRKVAAILLCMRRCQPTQSLSMCTGRGVLAVAHDSTVVLASMRCMHIHLIRTLVRMHAHLFASMLTHRHTHARAIKHTHMYTRLRTHACMHHTVGTTPASTAPTTTKTTTTGGGGG